MSLSLAFNTSRSSLLTTSTQLAVSSRNVAGAGDPSISRKIAVTTTAVDGSTRVVTISRATGTALFDRMLGSTSVSAGQVALLEGLTRLQQTVGDTEDTTSPAAQLGVFENALASAANTPDSTILAQAAVTAAQDLATALNSATDVVQKVRSDADSQIAISVAKINDLLTQFQTENNTVIKGTVNGADITDALDRRDALLSKLSEEIGISTVTRSNNDIVIYTDSGATLFETSPRAVSFQSSPVLDASTAGKSVFVDGVAVTGSTATMPIKSGRIAGLTELRDEVTVTYQTQLDEIARALVTAFAETDQTGGTAPAAAGLFTVSAGVSTIPSVLTPGLAGTITVNALADPGQGGDTDLVRDGGFNGAAYQYNTSGAASFRTRLQEQSDALGAARTYDSTTSLANNVDLSAFATSSVSWLQGVRKAVSGSVDSEQAVLSQASNALSNATGINLDQEYATQLELERSYQASSKLISVVNQLFDSLFAMIR